MINLHRYEALYYVGTYGGIGPAARGIPWIVSKYPPSQGAIGRTPCARLAA